MCIEYCSLNINSYKTGHCGFYCKVDLSGLGTLMEERIEKLVDFQIPKDIEKLVWNSLSAYYYVLHEINVLYFICLFEIENFEEKGKK